MADYIEREEAEKIFVEYSCVKYHVTEMGDTNEANRIVLMFRENAKSLFSLAPSADVATVRHGHWILPNKEKTDRPLPECSCCGWYVSEGGVLDFAYCPHCGARMNEEANDGQDDSDR